MSKIISFKDYLLSNLVVESEDFDSVFKQTKQIFDEFLEYLSDYMDMADKEAISKLYELTKNTPLISSKNKVFRVMCTKDGEIDFGKREMISTSVSKIKGKVLLNVIEDMKDRYKRHKNLKKCEILYVEISTVEGIDIDNLIKTSLKKGTALNVYLDDYYLDLFKRLKPEKEFLAINNNLTISNTEKV